MSLRAIEENIDLLVAKMWGISQGELTAMIKALMEITPKRQGNPVKGEDDE